VLAVLDAKISRLGFRYEAIGLAAIAIETSGDKVYRIVRPALAFWDNVINL
jgi:hypothetical protein